LVAVAFEAVYFQVVQVVGGGDECEDGAGETPSQLLSFTLTERYPERAFTPSLLTILHPETSISFKFSNSSPAARSPASPMLLLPA
jgi:hypothetical protein